MLEASCNPTNSFLLPKACFCQDSSLASEVLTVIRSGVLLVMSLTHRIDQAEVRYRSDFPTVGTWDFPFPGG